MKSLLHLRKALFLGLSIILLFLNERCTSSSLVDAKSKVYIVYMDKKQHNEAEVITRTHHQMLTKVLGSKEASEASIIYSYKHGFSGFAAKLTETQAQMLSELPGVAQVKQSHIYKLQTTRSWDYLGLSPHVSATLLQNSNMGDGVIIGVLDTGIWPESELFNDEGLGLVPTKWKGFCESGELFNGAKSCNRKLIGARYFVKGLLAAYGQPYNTSDIKDYLSPRGSEAHGTQTSFVAAGSFVANVSYNGLGLGIARGGAPRAPLAMYKVCWNLYDGVCADADILKAFDEAIHDGVDVMSVSIASDIPSYSDVDRREGIATGSFHAVAKGITVVCAAGNEGPHSQTVQNTAPWILTVAASKIDRSFPTPITLGNKKIITGQAMFTGADTGFTNLVYPEVSDLADPRYCGTLESTDAWIKDNVVLCFTSQNYVNIYESAVSVKEGGGLGLIVARYPGEFSYSCPDDFPCVEISYELGYQILNYIRSNRRPQVKLGPSRTYIGRPVTTKVAAFSSRGPNPISPAILKPDIAAPGSHILMPTIPSSSGLRREFAFESGTSFATPHVAAIAALLKSLHPDWSPAAIKSAIMTTAWTTDPSGGPIYTEENPAKIADPFDYGSGIVNPNRAANPGLVYDMDTAGYIHYLCAKGYNSTVISQLVEHPTFCLDTPSVLDVNLPSITIPSITNLITLTRTVTNVGDVNSVYKAFIEHPHGTRITVEPKILIFNSAIKKITFEVTVYRTYQASSGYSFGSLTWKYGMHAVRSPIAARTENVEYSNNDD